MVSDLFKFVHTIPLNAETLGHVNHEWYLVLLAVVFAVFSGWSALSTIENVVLANTAGTKFVWNCVGGICLGCGIWAMHFTAMASMIMPIKIEYDLWLTFMSIVAAIVFCSLAMWSYSFNQKMLNTLLSCGLFTIGIIMMHYLGMAAMVMKAQLFYEQNLFILSIVVGFCASVIALTIPLRFLRTKNRPTLLIHLLFSLVIGGAVSSMHFTAMAGTTFVLLGEQVSTGPTIVISPKLITIVTLFVATVILLGIVGGIFHRHWILNQSHLTEIKNFVTELRFAKISMEKLAYTDQVTGLGNRRFLDEKLDKVITQCLNEHNNFFLFFIDIDNFKNINDSYGHVAGDQLLKSVAKRLVNNLRSADIVTRFGGDEFVVILSGLQGFEPTNVANKIRRALQTPFSIQNKTFIISISIGITCYPKYANSAAELLRTADIALYKAKELGKNRSSIFTDEMNLKVRGELQLESDLREAMKHGNIDIHYQPIVDFTLKKTVQLEALARWNNQGVVVSPVKFIQLAEDKNLIVSLGMLIFKKVISDMSDRASNGFCMIKTSINLSPLQFRDSGLVDQIEDVLNIYQVSPDMIEFEITENCLIQNMSFSIKQLERLKNLGISIAIDDFGTGYSSLSYLKKLPIDKLKIDRSFVTSLPHNKDDVAINDAVIAMANGLNLEVVVEGIETEAQAQFFVDRNIRHLQGYLFSRPLFKDDVVAFILQEKNQHNEILMEESIN